MLPMLANPVIYVMVPYIIDQTFGVCVDEVVVALEVLVYNIVVALHHVQFAQIHDASDNARWLIIHHLLLAHLDEV